MRAWALLLLAGVAGMLFYIDRQTLSVLKTTLKTELDWTDTHYSWLVTAFMSMTGLLMSDLVPRRMVGTLVAIMSAFGAAMGTAFNFMAGPLIEAVGYSSLLIIVSMLHPLAAGILWWNYGHGRTISPQPART